MILNQLDECIKKGLIKKMTKSRENAERSISRSKIWLLQAQAAKSVKIYDSCILASYESIFHSARALLIKDGYRERSHYCMARYVDGMYVKKKLLDARIIDIIDNYRELRHNAAYNIEFEAGEMDAENAIRDAKIVLNAIQKLFNKV